MPLGTNRDKVLYGIGKARGTVHRYTWWRWAVGVFCTVAIAALPLGGILRFDFWGGRHVVLGEVVDLTTAAKAFAFPFLAVNVLIILASRFYGRYLCGFVCPYGSLARLQEFFRFHFKKRSDKWLGKLILFAVCLLLSAITFSFWVDWRVFVAGSAPAIGLSAAFLGGMTLSFYLFLRRLGLGFCRDYCPSGVYFALLGHETSSGIEFANPDSCTECKACEKVCPMDLMPRELSGGAHREASGFYPDSLSNFSLCIRCGDCVAACEETTVRDPAGTPLRMGWLPPEARDVVDRSREGAAAGSEEGS